MRSFTRPSFWSLYHRLPEHVRQQARASYRLFEVDPYHPSLRFKRVSQRQPVYSARVSGDYRAVGLRDGDTMVWFWIGSHHDYDRLLKGV